MYTVQAPCATNGLIIGECNATTLIKFSAADILDRSTDARFSARPIIIITYHTNCHHHYHRRYLPSSFVNRLSRRHRSRHHRYHRRYNRLLVSYCDRSITRVQ